MTPQQLTALRRLLFMTTEEAARHIGHTQHARTWTRYESGQRAIPDHVADRLHGFIAWREGYLAILRAGDQQSPAVSPSSAFYKPQQSALAQLLAEEVARYEDH